MSNITMKAPKGVKLNTDIQDYKGKALKFKLHGKDAIMQYGNVPDAVYDTVEKRTKMRYKIEVNKKESKHLLRSWQSVYQIKQIILSGDADKLFTKAGEIKSALVNDIGTNAIINTFDYVCPLSLYNKDEVSQAVNRAINNGNNFKKDRVWDKFSTFPTQS
jgi:hypothetical protein